MCLYSLLGKSKGDLWPALVLTFCHFSEFDFEVSLREGGGCWVGNLDEAFGQRLCCLVKDCYVRKRSCKILRGHEREIAFGLHYADLDFPEN